MTWIPYNKAISKNITGYPNVGDKVLYKARGGKYPVFYQAEIEKVINFRRYIVKYEVPEDVKKHFINGTTCAIAKLENLSFFCSVEDEEKPEE